ncbi:hypothetical protein V6N13_060127 [Hibiscus sabdariffa]
MFQYDGFGAERMNWRALFGVKNDQSLQFFPPVVSEDGITIEPPPDVFDKGILLWQNTLVAQFIGTPPNFLSLQRLVKQIWGKCGEIVINSAGENLFLFQFHSDDDCDWVLDNGHWHIQNKPLILRKWTPNLKSLEFSMCKLPVWVHLSGVPLELFTNLGLSYISSALGTPLYMDSITACRQRVSYAKVCVEVAADYKFPKFLDVKLRDGAIATVRVEVPWFPPRCTKCCLFGHSDKACIQKHSSSQVWVPKKQGLDAIIDPSTAAKGKMVEQTDASSIRDLM